MVLPVHGDAGKGQAMPSDGQNEVSIRIRTMLGRWLQPEQSMSVPLLHGYERDGISLWAFEQSNVSAIFLQLHPVCLQRLLVRLYGRLLLHNSSALLCFNASVLPADKSVLLYRMHVLPMLCLQTVSGRPICKIK